MIVTAQLICVVQYMTVAKDVVDDNTGCLTNIKRYDFQEFQGDILTHIHYSVHFAVFFRSIGELADTYWGIRT